MVLISLVEICGPWIQHLESKQDGNESDNNYCCYSRREHTEYQELSLLIWRGSPELSLFPESFGCFLKGVNLCLNIALSPLDTMGSFVMIRGTSVKIHFSNHRRFRYPRGDNSNASQLASAPTNPEARTRCEENQVEVVDKK